MEEKEEETESTGGYRRENQNCDVWCVNERASRAEEVYTRVNCAESLACLCVDTRVAKQSK